jgi:DnaK suppressor protein
MTRQAALLKLQNTLRTRRDDLRRKLAGELANLREFRAADSAGDSVDAAFEASSDEVSSRLAELEDRELHQIERALGRLRKGTYGFCAGGSEECQKTIPLARLNALPYTTFCINCERDMEAVPDCLDRRGAGTWKQVFDWEAPRESRRVNVSELEMSLSSGR